MPSNRNNLVSAIRNTVSALAAANGMTTEALISALTVQEAVEGSGGCCCSDPAEGHSVRRPVSARYSGPVEFNKMRTIVKVDCPGFTNESLTVTVKSKASHDVLVINGANEFRQKHEEVIVCPEGMRLDRATAKAQLRLGVLKVTGRTYKRATPMDLIDASTKRIPIHMVNG